jgi:phosphatidylserine decarboxylase
MLIAREGWREILLATLILGALAIAAAQYVWWWAMPLLAVWLWVLSFFRDPRRQQTFQPGELCSPADGTVTEVSVLDHHDAIGGPAVRVGIFLSLFNVHINRSPCAGWVRFILYKAGEFLDARHPQSGERNESNAILMEPDGGLPGPVQVRQVAGKIARRIICQLQVDQYVPIGARIGLIKFGSRTELIIPRLPGTEILIRVGDKVRGGRTVLARQPLQRLAAATERVGEAERIPADMPTT